MPFRDPISTPVGTVRYGTVPDSTYETWTRERAVPIQISYEDPEHFEADPEHRFLRLRLIRILVMIKRHLTLYMKLISIIKSLMHQSYARLVLIFQH